MKKREKVGLKECNNSKAFIEYSNDIQDVGKSILAQSWKKRKILIYLNDMVDDMISNIKLNSIVTWIIYQTQKD